MRKKTMEILVKMGIPVDIQGFHYICDAMEIYAQDESFIKSKTCVLYQKIADQNGTSATGVERCMRHAFMKAVNNGQLDVLNKYRVVSQKNTNRNLLACLYMTLREM